MRSRIAVPTGRVTIAMGRSGSATVGLSIIDLSDAARQPMATPDGRYTITYNGEIYNFREFESALSARGHLVQVDRRYRGAARGIRRMGHRSARLRLNGMFAFAIWDSREQRLTIARDRFGVKPLYILRSAARCLFASEIKAFRAFRIRSADGC